MELWFILAVASIFVTGGAAFLHKVVAERHLDVPVITFYGQLIATAMMGGVLLWGGDFSGFWHPVLLFAVLGAATYFFTILLKVEALKQIDTAVFFPLYKVIGPLFAIAIGIFFFAEKFTSYEWIGLVLSMLVPLLLITKAENGRQKNLIRGLLFLLMAAAIAAASIAFSKQGTNITPNIWLFLTIGEFLVAITAGALMFSKYRWDTSAHIKQSSTPEVLRLSVYTGLAHGLGAYTLIYSFYVGGPLGIVYTISSLYILIPIILSIIFYNEHWNARKVLAIILSIAALWFLR